MSFLETPKREIDSLDNLNTLDLDLFCTLIYT